MFKAEDKLADIYLFLPPDKWLHTAVKATRQGAQLLLISAHNTADVLSRVTPPA